MKFNIVKILDYEKFFGKFTKAVVLAKRRSMLFPIRQDWVYRTLKSANGLDWYDEEGAHIGSAAGIDLYNKLEYKIRFEG